MRVRIESDGTDAGTKVTNAVTGEPIAVRDYVVSHPLGEEAQATLVVPMPEFDLEARVERIEGVCPHCGTRMEIGP